MSFMPSIPLLLQTYITHPSFDLHISYLACTDNAPMYYDLFGWSWWLDVNENEQSWFVGVIDYDYASTFM